MGEWSSLKDILAGGGNGCGLDLLSLSSRADQGMAFDFIIGVGWFEVLEGEDSEGVGGEEVR